VTAMFAAAARIADAVVWEGYVLYPYRASAAKNQLRWPFGVLTPRPFSEADGFERCTARTECLVDVARSEARVDVRVRYLQVQTRTIEAAVAGEFVPVAELEADGTLWASWDEAVEHTVDVAGIDLVGASIPREFLIHHEATSEIELLGDAGRIVRRRWPIDAVVRVDCERLASPFPLTRIRVSVDNTTDWCDPTVARDEVMRRSLVAVHVLLHADGATFISSLDPPEFARTGVEACSNDGLFPVLAGDRSRPALVLASPIILYDFPEVAAASPGDMCDATEIDEILALRILTLTDDEKRLARSTDPRAAAIVDRIEAFTPETFGRLHGEMRPISFPTASAPPADAGTGHLPWWDPAVDASVNPWEDAVWISGVSVAKGCRVRLRPGRAGRRTDAQDLFVDGMDAVVEGVFFDVDGERHVAVTIDADGATDAGSDKGRFRYFHPDEIEPLA